MQRIRIRFSRGEELKFISHLDIMRLWQRVLHRAGIPLAYTEGYHFRPRIDKELLYAYSEGVSCLSGCLAGELSQLFLVDKEAEAEALADLDDSAFRSALETQMQGLLGTVTKLGPRSLFPLSGLTVDVAGQNRIALVGEAAHVMPPIGAQGLNLGLRDAAALADCVSEAHRAGTDIGGNDVLQAFTRARRLDITTRIWSVDLLNRSLGGVIRWGSFLFNFHGDLTDTVEKHITSLSSKITTSPKGPSLLPKGDLDVTHLSHHGLEGSTSQGWVDWLLPADGKDRNALVGANGMYMLSPAQGVLNRAGARVQNGYIWLTVPAMMGGKHQRLRVAKGAVAGFDPRTARVAVHL